MSTPTIMSHGYDNIRNETVYRWSDGAVTTTSTRPEVIVAELIKQSVRTNSIKHAEWEGPIADALAAESEDYTETADVVEYWGTTEGGDEWRVHLDKVS